MFLGLMPLALVLYHFVRLRMDLNYFGRHIGRQQKCKRDCSYNLFHKEFCEAVVSTTVYCSQN